MTRSLLVVCYDPIRPSCAPQYARPRSRNPADSWLPDTRQRRSAFRCLFPEEPCLHRTTIFTSLSGTTITLTTCLPETKGWVLGSASARLSSSSLEVPNGTQR